MQDKKCKPFTNHTKEINTHTHTHTHIYIKVINSSVALKHAGHPKGINCSTVHVGKKKKI